MDTLASLKVASSEAVEACKREKREKHKAGCVGGENLESRETRVYGATRRTKSAKLTVG